MASAFIHDQDAPIELATGADDSLRRVTRLVVGALGVDASLLALADGNRGFPDDLEESRFLDSFCREVAAEGGPLAIDDARRDRPDGGATEELGMAAHAGVPVRLADRRVVGALCASSVRPRSWSSDDMRLLEDLAATVATEIELRRACPRRAEELRALIEQIPMVTYVVEHGERVTARYISPQIEAWTGHPPARWTADPDFWLQFVHPDDRERVTAAILESHRLAEPIELEYRMIATDGRVRNVWVRETIIRDDAGRPTTSQGAIIDVTALRRTEAALEVSQRHLGHIVQAAPMILFAIDADGIFTLSEGKALELIGLRPGEAVGQSAFDLYRDAPAVLVQVRRAVAGERFASLLQVGEAVFEMDFSPVLDEDGGLRMTIGIATDVTDRHRQQQQIAQLAYRDRVTGLPNREALEERLRLVNDAGGDEDRAHALLHVDLDDFRTVNDSLGQESGDEILRMIGDRLRACAGRGHFLSRQGGDEFRLLLEDVDGDPAVAAERAAAEVLEAIRRPVEIADAELHLGATIGISLIPGDAGDTGELLRHAEVAMYEAKRADRGGSAHYDPGKDDAARRLELTTRMRRALARDEFELHYQPVWDMSLRRPIGVEALIRWRDPERGLMPPGDFIPVAEQTGLIEPIGDWVIDEVCRQSVAWREMGLDIRLAFNVSAQQLRCPRFAAHLSERIKRSGADPSSLLMEITESAAMGDPSRVRPMLEQLSAIGLRLAIDDFGADFSSLSRLRELPVHVLKIDRSFLQGVPGDERASAFVAAIVALARELGMEAVAEGVETDEQRSFLLSEGCLRGQGFGLARPMPVAEATKLLLAQTR